MIPSVGIVFHKILGISTERLLSKAENLVSLVGGGGWGRLFGAIEATGSQQPFGATCRKILLKPSCLERGGSILGPTLAFVRHTACLSQDSTSTCTEK